MLKRVTITMLMVCFLCVAVGADAKDYKKGTIYVSPVVGLNSFALPFGVSVEMAIKENIGVGGTIIAYFWSDKFMDVKWSYTVINPSVDFYYHLNEYIPVEKLDVWAGASLGYNIFSSSTTFAGGTYKGDLGGGFFLSPFIGARYYLKSNLAIFFRSGWSAVGSLSGFGAVVGVTLPLKKK